MINNGAISGTKRLDLYNNKNDSFILYNKNSHNLLDDQIDINDMDDLKDINDMEEMVLICRIRRAASSCDL